MTGPLPHRELKVAFRVWRSQHNVQAQDFAKMIGCSPRMLSAVELGHTLIPYDWLTRVPDELVSETEIAIRRQRMERVNGNIRGSLSERFRKSPNIVDIRKRKA